MKYLSPGCWGTKFGTRIVAISQHVSNSRLKHSGTTSREVSRGEGELQSPCQVSRCVMSPLGLKLSLGKQFATDRKKVWNVPGGRGPGGAVSEYPLPALGCREVELESWCDTGRLGCSPGMALSSWGVYWARQLSRSSYPGRRWPQPISLAINKASVIRCCQCSQSHNRFPCCTCGLSDLLYV